MYGKHIDFSGVRVFDDETGYYDITRVNPAEHRCEACMKPAEYLLRSEWDVHGQCEVAECQSCLVAAAGSFESPDMYVAKS